MKALSIKQPWAWAICNLPEPYKKDVENRTRRTNFRGEFLVHASKTFDNRGYFWMQHILKKLGYEDSIPKEEEFIKGAIVGISTIEDCKHFINSKWFDGPYGYVLTNSAAFKKPIPYKGMLGFFEIDQSIIQNSERN